MEQHTTSKIAEEKKRREETARTKKRLAWALALVFAIVLCVGGFFLKSYLARKEISTSRLTYQTVALQEGEIHDILSGSGTLTANREEAFTAPGDFTTVESVHYRTGETVPAGSVVMILSCLEVEEEIALLEESLDEVLDELTDVTQGRKSLSVTAPNSGIVKNIQGLEGSICEDLDYLCLISTDGTVKVVAEHASGLSLYDRVICQSGALESQGRVMDVDPETGAATILAEDVGFLFGAVCTLLTPEGEILGTGTFDVNEYVKVTVPAGKVAAVNCTENQKVSRGKSLFTLEEGAPSEAYLDLKQQREDLEEQIQNLKDGLIITADWDAMLTSLSVSKGDSLSEGAILCTLSGTDGYQLSLAIDELDISSVTHGQQADVTLDAIGGTYAGTVENISYAGSGSYVTSYTVSILTEPIPGAYPGMSASGEVVVKSSGNSLILPVSAIQYEGRGREQKAFVYLAEEESPGLVKDADALNLASLTRVYVEPGMSDGSYIAVQVEGLSAGDLIWQSSLVTTAIFESEETTTQTMPGSMGGMGGFPGGSGGGMPSFSGGGMPGGGSFPGGMQGQRGNRG